MSSLVTPRVATVISIGPSDQDHRRMDDLLDALAHFGVTGPIIINNDGAKPAALEELLRKYRLSGHVVANPRAGIGNHWMGRLTVGVGNGFSYVRRHYPDHHVLKLDTDALILRPYHSRLTALLAAHSDVGLIGSVELQTESAELLATPETPAPARGGFSWSTVMYRRSRRVTRSDRWPFVALNLFGARAALRRLLLRASAHGYAWGDHTNGGAYILTAEANRRIGTLTDLWHPGVIANDWITEDLVFGIAVYAAGLKIVRQQNPGDTIASCWKGLIGRTLDEVWARDNCVVHSVKDYLHFKEEETRAYYRARRLASAAAVN
jgi:hypothetical protein